MEVTIQKEDLEKLFAEAIQRGIIIEENRIHHHAARGKKIEDVLVNRGFRLANMLIADNHSKSAKKEAKEMTEQMFKQMDAVAK
jgi:hypothetical protein